MLRARPIVKKIPSKTILEDVLTRPKGSIEAIDGRSNYSPFVGMDDLIQEQFRGSARDRFNLFEFLEFAENRDLDPTKINIKAKTYDDVEEEKENAGFRVLEDMKDSDELVRNYIRNLLIGYKLDARSPYREENRMKEIRFISNDDGDVTDEREWIEEDAGSSLDARSEVVEKIPHLVKQVWQHSREKNVHLMSFLIAFESIINVEKKSPRDIKPIDFAKYDTYMLTVDGRIKKKFNHTEDNKGEYYRYGREWSMGYYSEQESYKAARKLVAIAKHLGYNIYEEEPLLYSERLMNRMVCTYVPTNEEYVAQYGKFDPELALALDPGNIFKLRSEFRFSKVEDIITSKECDDIYNITMYINTIRELDQQFDDLLSQDRTEDIFKYIEKVFKLYTGKGLNLVRSAFTYANDILCMQGEYFKLPCSHINEVCDGVKISETIVHRCGLVIVFNEDVSSIHYVTLDTAIKAVDEKLGGGFYVESWIPL